MRRCLRLMLIHIFIAAPAFAGSECALSTSVNTDEHCIDTALVTQEAHIRNQMTLAITATGQSDWVSNSQQAWGIYREKQCALEAAVDNKNPLAEKSCILRMGKERIDLLQRLPGMPEAAPSVGNEVKSEFYIEVIPPHGVKKPAGE